MKNTQQFEKGKIVPSNAKVLCEYADEIRLEYCSLGKEFGLVTEEFCRLGKELKSAKEEFGLAKLLSGRLAKEFG